VIEIDLSADVAEAERQLWRYEKEVIPKALSRSINTTQRNMVTAINRYMAKVTGLKIADLKSVQFMIRSTPRTHIAILITRRRPYNLRRFVAKSRLRVGGFDKQTGVIANPWKTRRLFPGTFIIKGRTHGELIVVKRTGANRKGLKGVYGPSAAQEIQRPAAQALIRETVLTRFRINFERDLAYYSSRI